MTFEMHIDRLAAARVRMAAATAALVAAEGEHEKAAEEVKSAGKVIEAFVDNRLAQRVREQTGQHLTQFGARPGAVRALTRQPVRPDGPGDE